jgi:hypothetical protein
MSSTLTVTGTTTLTGAVTMASTLAVTGILTSSTLRVASITSATTNGNIVIEADGNGIIQVQSVVRGGFNIAPQDYSVNWAAMSFGESVARRLVMGIIDYSGVGTDFRPHIAGHTAGLDLYETLWINMGGTVIFGDTTAATGTAGSNKIYVVGHIATSTKYKILTTDVLQLVSTEIQLGAILLPTAAIGTTGQTLASDGTRVTWQNEPGTRDTVSVVSIIFTAISADQAGSSVQGFATKRSAGTAIVSGRFTYFGAGTMDGTVNLVLRDSAGVDVASTGTFTAANGLNSVNLANFPAPGSGSSLSLHIIVSGRSQGSIIVYGGVITYTK